MQVEYVNHYGDDNMVASAARVSFSKRAEEYSAEQNERLIHFLARENHWVPFSHPQITMRMKAPTSIRTQCFKHKIGFAESEESRRYIRSTPRLFIPDTFRAAPENAKQGSGGTHVDSDYWLGQYTDLADRAIEIYEAMISERVAPEQARFILPQGVEVEWYWTGSLAAFARFCKQRLDPHAQLEVRQLAHAVSQHIRPLFPVSWAALMK